MLVVLAYRGHSIIWVAPLCAIVVALLGGIALTCLMNIHQLRTLLTAVNEGANGSLILSLAWGLFI